MCLLKYFKERKEQKLKTKRISDLESSINYLELHLPYVIGISYGDDDPGLIEYLNEIEKDKQELKKLKESL